MDITKALPKLISASGDFPGYICISIPKLMEMIETSRKNEDRGSELMSTCSIESEIYHMYNGQRLKAQGFKEAFGEIYFYGFGKFPEETEINKLNAINC
jgi:hypothetical protein